MFLPLDNLYDWINQLIPSTLIYRFLPHGSRKLEDLNLVADVCADLDTKNTSVVICHDQEPLDFDRYVLEPNQLRDLCVSTWPQLPEYQLRRNNNDLYWEFLSKKNLGAVCLCVYTQADQFILLHSELRSPEIVKYRENGFVTSYWWSHGMIARDWYRFAQHDRRLVPQLNHQYQFDFNIYCRAWSGSREYRLKFLELLQQQELVSNCRISFDQHDQGQHYSQHSYNNPKFQVDHLNTIPVLDTVPSSASATYDHQHYSDCAVDVVLETLFDDERLHLTEKILRPIACGKPFLLAGTQHSLDYLKSYGFQTFSDYWDESYDNIADPVERLHAITDVMKTITKSKKLWAAIRNVCNYNQNYFFSDQFARKLSAELVNNLTDAQIEIRRNHQHGKDFAYIQSITDVEIKKQLLGQ